MALKRSTDKNACPECGDKLLVNEGAFVIWLICPSCKFRKLKEKTENKKIEIKSLKE